MSAIRQARIDASFNRLLARANGDARLLARIAVDLILTEEREDPEPRAKSRKHRPQLPGKRGAPKGKNNPLPYDMKNVHAERALNRMRRLGIRSNRMAALLELSDHNVNSDDMGLDDFYRLWSNLQKRISERIAKE